MSTNVQYGVIGYGVTGRAAVNWCERNGASFLIADDKQIDRAEWREFALLSPESAERWIVSPGITPNHSFVAGLCATTIETDVSLALGSYTGTCVGITGTNGKTSTTQMVNYVMNAVGWDARSYGNVGRSPLSEDMLPANVVVEMSSFQLHYGQPIHYDAAAILNLASDHLSWHGGFEEYVQAKLSITSKADAVVVPANAEWVSTITQPTIIVNAIDDDNRAANNAGVYWSAETLVFDCPEWAPKQSASWPDTIRNWPRFQQENAAFACALLVLVGIPLLDAVQELASFEFDAHRMEFVATKNGVTYINDSKATNPHAVVAAVGSLQTSTILLLGGVFKGGSLSALKTAGNIKTIVVFGQDSAQIIDELSSAGLPTPQQAESLQSALQMAATIAENGDTVLLSPACASFDEFDNYMDRGEHYRDYVNAL